MTSRLFLNDLRLEIMHSCVCCVVLYRGGARILVQGGNIKQNFIHEFLSSPVLQWRRQNFGSKGDIQQKCTHQTLF